jgi:hypothetical protein
LAALHRLPGTAALRQVLRAVEGHGADAGLLREAESALRAFDEFVERAFDDRAGMEAVLATTIPRARRNQEAVAKQTMYRGAVGLKGVTSDVIQVAFIAYPSAGDERACDLAIVNGFVGLRRVRPRATAQFLGLALNADQERSVLDNGEKGRPGPLLQEFCSSESSRLVAERDGGRQYYTLPELGVGSRSGINYFMGEHLPACHRRYREEPTRPWFHASVDHPTKLLVFDVLIHKEMWPGSDPELAIYDTITYGIANPNDCKRDKDRLDLVESVETLGVGIDRFICGDIPNYTSILEATFKRVGQNAGLFRGYRCRIPYPFYGSQVCMMFDPAAAPGGTANSSGPGADERRAN